MKILIVDDNRDNLYLLKTLLKGRGYEVVSAINGSEALEKLRAAATDMVISDILMPVMDGFQLCREVKRDDNLKDIPFVFNTGTYTDEKDEELAFKMGADKFIRKPVEPDEFIKIIQAVMKDVEKGKLEPKRLAFEEEKEILKLYNERLVKKLEKKKLDLEREITERKQAEDALRGSEASVKKILMAAPIGIGMVRDRVISWVSDRFIEMVGFTRDELIGKSAKVVYEDDKEFDRVGREKYGQISEKGIGEVDTRLKRKDGSIIHVHLRSTSVDPNDLSAGVIFTALDITERKRMEERLRLLSSALEQSSDGIAVTDLEGNLLFVNNAFATMHGYAAEELVGRHLSLFHTTEQMPSVEAANRQMQNTGEFSGEIWHVRRGGMVFPALMHNSLLRDEAGNTVGMIGSLIDITEHKRAEKALRESEERLRYLSSQLITAQEEERKGISLELHDEMGQTLTAIGLNLESIGKELTPEHAAMIKDKLAETISLVEHASDHVRDLSLDLRPSMLDDLGLLPTLRWYVNSYEKRTETPVIFEALNLEERLAPEVEIVLYRIVQESLNNIRKHAQAKKVKIRLEQKKKKIGVLIEDDGIGFHSDRAVSETTLVKGIGLLGMQERVRLLGGSLKIRSREGQGTSIFVELPLH